MEATRVHLFSLGSYLKGDGALIKTLAQITVITRHIITAITRHVLKATRELQLLHGGGEIPDCQGQIGCLIAVGITNRI